jgi:single-strand DNA-binding protein
MAADNHTTIVGNLVDDPEVRFTSSGIAVANLRVAVTQRVQQDGQWRDGDTSFFKVNVWRDQAENLAESLVTKGDRVMVTGRLRQRSWETPEGDKRSGACRRAGRRLRRGPAILNIPSTPSAPSASVGGVDVSAR